MSVAANAWPSFLSKPKLTSSIAPSQVIVNKESESGPVSSVI